MSKITSRKLWVFVVWSVIAVACLFVESPKETIFTFYGLVSLAYIGGNVAEKFTPVKKEV